MDDYGQYEVIRERHESLVARMSPGAKHAAFPTVYARPLPIATDAEKLLGKIGKLEGNNKALTADIAALRDENKRLVGMLSRLQNLTVLPVSEDRATLSEVIAVFCSALNAEDYEVKDGAITVAHLQGGHRHREYSNPRLVAMWLCRRICSHASTPMIGKAFGGRDHTTTMHACKRAPSILDGSIVLRRAASRVLASFGVVI